MHISVLAGSEQQAASPSAAPLSRTPSQPSPSAAPHCRSLVPKQEQSLPAQLVAEVGEGEMGTLGEIVQLSSFTFLSIYNAIPV